MELSSELSPASLLKYVIRFRDGSELTVEDVTELSYFNACPELLSLEQKDGTAVYVPIGAVQFMAQGPRTMQVEPRRK